MNILNRIFSIRRVKPVYENEVLVMTSERSEFVLIELAKNDPEKGWVIGGNFLRKVFTGA